MTRTAYLAAVGVALGSVTSHAGVSIEFIGDNVFATSVSADGSVVVGNTQGDFETFRWTSTTGVELLGRATVPVLGSGAGAPEVSNDGMSVSATVLGTDSTYITQGRWSPATALRGASWQETMPPTPPDGGLLDNSYGSAWGISGDGTTVVGLYWRPGQAATGLAHPCYWTQATGVVDLGTAGGSGRANAASFDASVICGWEENPAFGNWWPTVWVDGVRTNLSTDDFFHEAWTVNPAGTIIGGHAPDAQDFLVGALWRWNGSIWEEELIGRLSGHHQNFGLTTVNDMSADGSLVVGYDRRSNPSDATGFLWTAATGIMNVTTFLADNGVTLPPGFVIRSLTAVTDDGLTIAGSGEEIFPPFNVRSFLIHVDGAVGAPELTSSSRLPLRVYPNPTRGASTFSFDLARSSRVELGVYDAAGRLVKTLRDGREIVAGPQDVEWDGRDRAGNRVAPGVYFVRVRSGDERSARPIVIVR